MAQSEKWGRKWLSAPLPGLSRAWPLAGKASSGNLVLETLRSPERHVKRAREREGGRHGERSGAEPTLRKWQ